MKKITISVCLVVLMCFCFVGCKEEATTQPAETDVMTAPAAEEAAPVEETVPAEEAAPTEEAIAPVEEEPAPVEEGVPAHE